MSAVLHARGLRKTYRRVSGRRRWMDVLTGASRDSSGPVAALRDVDLDLDGGRAVAIVGDNGAGKTTLLRVLAGTLAPDAGQVERRGRLGSLLELGAGFHPELTGRESAVLAGVVAGRSRQVARREVGAICEAAGLEGFIDRPLRTYSSGMRARLAFAIATHVQPDVLLVDEVLAVGDVAFQQRCIELLHRFRRDGTAIAVVSHEPDLLRILCDRAVWLDAGSVVREGTVDEVLDAYLGGDRPPAPVLEDTSGGITAAHVIGVDGRTCRAVPVGAAVVVSVELGAQLDPANLSVRFVREDGLLCIDTSTPIEPGQTGATLRLDRLDLAPGGYRVEIGRYDPAWRRALAHRTVELRVLGTASASAALAPPARWQQGSAPVDDPGAAIEPSITEP